MAASMCSRNVWRSLACINLIKAGRSTISGVPKLPERGLFTKTESKGTTTKEENANTADPLSGDEKTAKAETPKESELHQKTVELQSKVDQLSDKYKRALAETENVRLRMTRQIQDAKLFGIQDFCKELLEVADILGKATDSVPPSELNNSNPHLKNLFEGLKMTEAQLHNVFRRNGLAQINPLGEKFDPNKHEALFEQVLPGKEPGTVAVVTKIGYSLHDRTIRPALVSVVKMGA